MDGHTLDWDGSAKLLLEEGRFEHPAELGRDPARTPARANRYWTRGNAARLWQAVLRRVSRRGGVPEGSPARALWDGALRKDGWNGRGAELVQQVALRCTGLPGMDRLRADADATAAADALNAHHAKRVHTNEAEGGERR